MEKQIRNIKLIDRNINYILKTSRRAKQARLVVYCDGSLMATKPWKMSEKTVEEFIIKKANWILSKMEHFKQFKKNNFFERDSKGEREKYLKHRNEALEFVKERVNYYGRICKVKFNKITVKNQKTKWGSCSKKRNLNFNYKILLLPRHIADYIVVHELCHLKEFNHSKRFWNLVAEIIPDYLEIRKEIKKKGLDYY